VTVTMRSDVRASKKEARIGLNRIQLIFRLKTNLQSWRIAKVKPAHKRSVKIRITMSTTLLGRKKMKMMTRSTKKGRPMPILFRRLERDLRSRKRKENLILPSITLNLNLVRRYNNQTISTNMQSKLITWRSWIWWISSSHILKLLWRALDSLRYRLNGHRCNLRYQNR
jgi:hypothetical protein